MAGYDLGSADLKIRKPLGKKQLEKVPELETEFIYGRLPIVNEKGHVIFFMPDGSQIPIDLHGKEEEVRKAVNDAYNAGGHPKPRPVDHDPVKDKENQSKNCIGAVNNGFSEELSIKIFEKIRAFAKYAFNKSHSGAYAAIAFKCASMSYHHPVEWSVACAGNYDNNDKIQATITAFRKRGEKVLAPSVNKSGLTFTVEDTTEGKAMRYGLIDIPYVGERAVKLMGLVRSKGLFTSFDDFINRCTDSNNQEIREYLGFNAKGNVNQNPINKSCITNLIKAGAFDELEENRYKLINHYYINIRKENVLSIEEKDAKGNKIKKDIPLPLDETSYARKEKLALEKEVMGSYISEHPLEPFPSVDFNTCGDSFVSFAGIIIKKAGKKTKGNKSYTELSVEVKDSSTVICRLFGKTHDEYAKICKEGKIVIVQGKYDTKWNNVTVNRVVEIVAANNPQLDDETAFQDIFQGMIPIKDDPLLSQENSSLNTTSVVDFFSNL